MTVKAQVILTDIGRVKIAHAAASLDKIKLAKFAVGDSNGADYVPTGKEIKLVHEVHRNDIALVRQSTITPSTIELFLQLLENVGPFYMRELGLFDVDGDMIAIGCFEAIYKPDPAQQAYSLTLEIDLTIDNADSVSYQLNMDGVTYNSALMDLFDKEIVKLNSPNLVNADSNFLGKLQKDGYDVATYNAGFNKSVNLTSDYAVKPTDANTIFRPQGNFLITANGKTTAFPVGFTFFIAGNNVLQYRVRTVNITGDMDTTVTLSASGTYQYMWTGGGWFITANSKELPDGLNITNPYNIGAGIVASGSNTDGSWVKFANGLIIQRLGITVQPGAAQTFTFPTAFTNIYYNIQISSRDITDSGADYRLAVENKNLTEFLAYSSYKNHALAYSILAIGY